MQTHRTALNQGSALLSALFIMTLVAIATTAMTLRLQIDIYKTELATKADLYYSASQLVVFWGINEIRNTSPKLIKLDNQGRVAEFPVKFKHNYPGLELSGGIYDMQGRFNLNNLKNKDGRGQLRLLLKEVEPKLQENEIQSITRLAWFWQNSFQLGRGFDSDSEAFIKAKPPSFPAHFPYVSISEFRMIPGVDGRLMNLIKPYLTALPKVVPVNINTASKTLLKTLAGLDEDKINIIIQQRSLQPIEKPEDLKKLFEKLKISPDNISIESQFFLIQSIVKSKTNEFVNFSLVEVKKNKKKNDAVKIRLIQESFNSI